MRGADGSCASPFDEHAAASIYHDLQRQFAQWQRRLLINLHNEWPKHDQPGDWIDRTIDDALTEPSATTMRDVTDAINAAYIGAAHSIIVQMARPVTKRIDDPNPALLRISTEATNYAASRGAEMVGRRYNDEGDLVDNPNADWAITSTVRDILRYEIRDAVATHRDVDKLADHIADTGAFSDYRAEMIARTETSMAMNQGVLEAGRQAEASGAKIQKVWTLGDDPCPLCEDAAAEGAIDLDEDFGGDAGDAPPLHPNCECSLDLFESDDDQADADEEDAQAAVDEEDAVEGYEPGELTPDGGDKDDRDVAVQEWADASPIQTIADVVDAAPNDQRLLVKVGDVVADNVGAVVKEGGHKVQTQKGIDRVLEKAGRHPGEGYSGQIARVSDVARMSMIITEPGQADQAISELSKYFEVAAEPWKISDVSYADRTANVRLPDGMIGEVQFMDERMAKAKAAGGHAQYRIMRDAAPAGPHPDKERYKAAAEASKKIYQPVLDSYSDDWKAALGIRGTAPNLP